MIIEFDNKYRDKIRYTLYKIRRDVAVDPNWLFAKKIIERPVDFQCIWSDIYDPIFRSIEIVVEDSILERLYNNNRI